MFNLYSLMAFSSICDPIQAILLPLKAMISFISCTRDFWHKTYKQKDAACTQVFTVPVLLYYHNATSKIAHQEFTDSQVVAHQ